MMNKIIAFLLLVVLLVQGNEIERIVGGTVTNTRIYPHQVAIVQQLGIGQYGIFCGGSIISENYVLTAAHCFRDISGGTNDDRSLRNIYAASTSRISGISSNKRYQVLQAFIHPQYSISVPTVNRVDICVLRVNTITFDAATKPVVLARPQDVSLFPPGTDSFVSGFGLTDGEKGSTQRPSDDLRQVEIPVVSLNECKQALANSGLFILYPIVCAGSDGKDACFGDSGGPLAIVTQNTYLQIGVVVSGTVNTENPIQCGAAGNYGVFTDVSAYRSSFIEPITGPLYNLGDSDVATNNATGASTAQNSSSNLVKVSLVALVLLILIHLY